jgi:hypothetical protein
MTSPPREPQNGITEAVGYPRTDLQRSHLGWNQEPSYSDGKPWIEKTEVLVYSGMGQYIELSRCESKRYRDAVLLVYYLFSYSDMKGKQQQNGFFPSNNDLPRHRCYSSPPSIKEEL